ncbi:hypothetical protein V1525DRAFT_350818, partial [Lipomyces kononenkoae]
IRPSVYQRIYNAIHRIIEAELLPCSGSRFDPQTTQGKADRARYWNDATFDALEIIRSVSQKYELTEAECALTRMMHHSKLRRELGDAVIIGASMIENLIDLEKGPLPDETLEALDHAWTKTKGVASNYFH